MLSFSGGEIALLLGCGGFCVVTVGMALVVVSLSLAGLGLRRRGSPATRLAALEGLGYQRIGERSWTMALRGTALAFHQNGRGWRWTVRLPGPATPTLHVEERETGDEPGGDPFLTGYPDLDARFAMGADRPEDTLPLVTNGGVRRALLAMPFVSLRIQGGELVVDDPELRALSKLTDGTSWPGSHETVGAECDIHEAVMRLVRTVFDSLYPAQTGAPLPENG